MLLHACIKLKTVAENVIADVLTQAHWKPKINDGKVVKEDENEKQVLKPEK